MKVLYFFLALTLFAQTSDRERALGSSLRTELLREARLLRIPPVDSYLKSLAPAYVIDVVDMEASAPIALPGGYILIPAAILRNAPSETALRMAITHAIAHIELRHGIRQDHPGAPTIFMGGASGVHPDPSRPTTIPQGFRKYQPQWEREADEYAAARVSPRPDSQSFLDAKAALAN